MSPSENILVTGFGPFSIYEVNPSWESVKLLPDTIEDLTVIRKEIPVSYDHVNENITRLWDQYKPKLVVHVGVSNEETKIKLESCAHKKGYSVGDIFGKVTETCPTATAEECLQSMIDLKEICRYLNSNGIIKAFVSDDAGRYLCEYIYYSSLSIDPTRTLFIHVPYTLGLRYSAQELAEDLIEVIKCALKQCLASRE